MPAWVGGCVSSSSVQMLFAFWSALVLSLSTPFFRSPLPPSSFPSQLQPMHAFKMHLRDASPSFLDCILSSFSFPSLSLFSTPLLTLLLLLPLLLLFFFPLLLLLLLLLFLLLLFILLPFLFLLFFLRPPSTYFFCLGPLAVSLGGGCAQVAATMVCRGRREGGREGGRKGTGVRKNGARFPGGGREERKREDEDEEEEEEEESERQASRCVRESC